ncbi:sulfonate transport system ATP-binding protein [Roseiarcus fermentans]|uniref:Sulfonate transport system ATP-binding protein n=1 Tax=Roseiarcus fermentans TaxID=1473586 RepID=A0A366F5C9_9HYPH|nr:ATP-binding cassette domain-containing protein [Roseiarcus fermentans]RBP09851.1 sulfonate transport system ATP-binding protein [Roseiarcus fermentans]
MNATALAASRSGGSPSAAGAEVEARAIRRTFGDTTVLRGLDFRAPAGAFVAVVGRSGCGKSTLLRLIAGLDAPDGGSVTIAGRPLADASDQARVMFQEPRLLPWASVLANVEVGLGAERDAPGRRERALAALASVGLADRAADWPATLSGGQRQRVALARALVSRPRVLALDEPLGALDALTRIEMQRLLESAWLRDGFTAVLVTHDVAEAVALADRIVLIERGAIALDVGVPLARPRHRGAAEFGRLEEAILARLLGDPAPEP